MGKPLKPCGTPAAYRRHKRNGEEPCADCKRAWSDSTQEAQGQRQPVEVDHIDFAGKVNSEANLSPLDELLDSLELVKAALHGGNCLPRDIGPLTKRREELVEAIVSLRQREEDDAESGTIGEDEPWDASMI